MARPLSEQGLGLTLHTDGIAQRAAIHYLPDSSLGCEWQKWKLKFDKTENSSLLESAILQSMQERTGASVRQHQHIVCEGVLAGHHVFRRMMKAVLNRLDFIPEATLTLGIQVSWAQLESNLSNRPGFENRDTRMIRAIRNDYLRRLRDQPGIQCFSTTDACLRAASEFLRTQ